MKALKKLLIGWRAFVAQIRLNRGAKLVRKGAVLQIGQPVRLASGKTRYVKNMFFNFRQNNITYKWSDRPIKGVSEKFKR